MAAPRAAMKDVITVRQCPAEAGLEPSRGSVGDSYVNAFAETVIGLYKTEMIRRRSPWRSLVAVEFATLEWVDWFNHRRLLEPIITAGRGRNRLLRPGEQAYRGLGPKPNSLRQTRGGSSGTVLLALQAGGRRFDPDRLRQ